MAKFKSPKVTVNYSAKDFFNKILELKNLKKIMPESVTRFKNTSTSCSFTIEDLPRIKLILKEKVPHSKITFEAENDNIPFLMNVIINEKNNKCQAQLEIHAELNLFMKMMVETPLTEFLEETAKKIKIF